MVDTLLDVTKEVLRATHQTVSITSFSDTNDTNWIVDRINDALNTIYDLKPTQVDLDGSVTLAASTRTVSPPTGLDIYRIYNWSYRINDSDGDIDLDFVTKEFIVTTFPEYETYEAEQPSYVYYDGNSLAFYPLLKAGSTALTIQFSYPAQFIKLTSPTDIFPFADRSTEMAYIKLCAQRDYEVDKGLGQPGVTQSKIDEKWGIIVAKYQKGKRVGFKGYRRYTNRGRI